MSLDAEPMDFAGLQSRVGAQYDAAAGTFAFDPAPFGSDAIDRLLDGVVGQLGWRLTGVDAAPAADAQRRTVTVAGRADTFQDQPGAPLAMVFFLDDAGSAQLLVKRDLPAGWSFTTAFPELQGTLFDDVGIQAGTVARYVFASAPFADSTLENGSFAPGMSFHGEVAPAGTRPPFAELMRVLGAFAHTTAVGPMAVSAAGSPDFALTLGVQQSLARYVPALASHLQIQLVARVDEDGSLVGLQLGTRFDLGATRGLELYTVLTSAPTGVLTLTGEFTGVPLPGPGDLAGLIGGADLQASLPEPFQDGSGLYLRRIHVGIGTRTLKPVLASLEIGMATDGPGWLLGDFATVSQVTLFASVQDPFDSATRLLSVRVDGELDLPTSGDPVVLQARAGADFAAGQPARYGVQAGLAPGSTLALPVGHLASRYLPSAVDLPDIVLGTLGVDFRFQQPKNHYGLYAGLDANHPLVFRFGGAAVFTVRYAGFHIENDSDGGGPGGGLAGGITIFGVDTDFSWQSGGPFRVTAQIPDFEVDLVQLANGLLDTQFDRPDWLPVIPFPQTSLFFLRSGTGAGAAYTFALQARPSFGTVVVEVLEQSTGWTLAAALQLDAPRIAAFGSLDMLSGMDDLFEVSELLFVIATRDLPGGFQFPPSTDFAGGSGAGVQVPSWTGAVKAGFYFYGSMALNTAKTPNLALVPKLFGLDVDLAFQLYVFLGMDPAQDATVQASFSGTLGSPSTVFRGILGARMEAGEPQFYLEGMVSTSILGSGGSHALASCDKPDLDDCLTAAVVFELTENAAFLSASMIGSVTFGPVTLSNLVIVVGVDFEGIPSLGFAAQIDLSLYQATYDSSIAFFLDSGDPEKSLFAGSISDITLRDVVDTLVGAVSGGDTPPDWMDDLLRQVGVSGTGTFQLPAAAAAALDGRDLAAVSAAFNQATGSTRFAFSRQSTLLVAGGEQLGRPGVWYLTDFPAAGQITHYELRAEGGGVTVSLEPQFYYCMPPGGGSVTLGPPGALLVFNPGVYLAGRLDFFMLHLDVEVQIQPNQGIAADVEVDQPIDVLSGFLSLSGNEDRTRGPRLSLSTFTVTRTDPGTQQEVTLPPHFYLDGRVRLLGLEVDTTVNVSSAGLLVDLELHAGDASLGADFVVKTTLSSTSGFSFEIGADVHIDDPHLELWHVDLGTLHLKLDIGATLQAGANANGLFLRLTDTHFTFGGTGFTIPAVELDVRTQQLTDIAGIVKDAVKNLIWDFLRDAEHWVEWVGQELIQGAKDVEEVLENVYNAISSVWGNEKMVVASVSESLIRSQSVTVTVTPAQPAGGVTQAMIDAAQAWAQQTAERVVAGAIIDQIRRSSPDDVADFQVNVLQDIDQSYQLDETVEWVLEMPGALTPLTTLGFANPFRDSRFYTRTQAARRFAVSVAVDADFAQTVQRVAVAVKYNGAQLGKPYLFTSQAAHQFTADWAAAAGLSYQVQYTVTYQDPSVPPVTSGWLGQRGTELLLPIPLPTRAAA